jgi:hypothetical protein
MASSSSTVIKNLADFTSAVSQTVDAWTPRDVDWYLQPWFRGHGDAGWSLDPSWFRAWSPGRGVGADFYNEGSLLEEFKIRAPMFLERVPTSDWEWLFLMQHYGLPTRLLDWTESSVIALYFAVRDNPGNRDAAVWMMNPWWLNRQTFGAFVLFPANDRRASRHAPRAPGQRLTVGLPIAIRASHGSARIAAQRGVFTIHGTKRDALDQLARSRRGRPTFIKRLTIPAASLGDMRRDLAIAGISEALIFPELSGLCNELRSSFFGSGPD